MATFSQYFHSVYQDDSRKDRLRSGSGKRGVPLLSKDRVNRVLVYPGSFNPPHVGHLGVLRHAFESSPDLNIVAAIVFTADVWNIEEKNYRSGRCLVLSSDQRLELWKRDARFPAWAFAPNYESSARLKEKIANAAMKDGYEILYVGLGGPDTWDGCPRQHAYASCAEYLISDAARSVPFLGPDSVPQQIEGYTIWQRLELDLQPGAEKLQHTKRRLRNSSVKSQSHFPIVRCKVVVANQYSDLDECHEQENTIWECFERCTVCRGNCNLGLRLRLVCKKTRDIGLLGSVTNEISSTALYQIITQSVGKDRLRRLQNQVLSTDLFCKFLKQNDFDECLRRR